MYGARCVVCNRKWCEDRLGVFTLKSYQTNPVKIGESRGMLTSRLEADLEVSLPILCLP